MSADRVQLVHAQSKQDIAQISRLAHIIWREYYPLLLSTSQIEYMLTNLQSADAISKDIDAGMQYYTIITSNQPAGYTAIKPNHSTNELFLSKFYLLKKYRGKGLATLIMDKIMQMAQEERQSSIWLTVNKENPSIERYKSLGFQIVGSEQTDIGEGYCMNDYIMKKRLLLTR